MVGPLKGKSYSKTVPIVTRPYKLNFFYATPNSDFYPYWFEGAEEYKDSFYLDSEKNKLKLPNGSEMTMDAQRPRYQLRKIVDKSYGNYYNRNDYKKRQRGRAIFTEATRLMMKEYGLQDPIYYVYNANAGPIKTNPPNIKPVNYNPPAHTLADFFMGLEWGECLFEEPPSDLEPAVRQTMLSIQSELIEKMRDWVDNQVGEMFYYDDEDEDGRSWSIPKDWALDMMADLGDQNIMPQFVDMVLGWHFSYLDLDDPLNVYLLENNKALEKFRDSDWLLYQCQIDLGIRGDLDDWLSELLDDYYD